MLSGSATGEVLRECRFLRSGWRLSDRRARPGRVHYNGPLERGGSLTEAPDQLGEPDTEGTVLVSVAIPAYNEETCIGDCLRSLGRQRTSARIEVVLCLNACTDGTARVASRVARRERLDLKLVDEPLKGIARARQRAFQHARGDIVLSADADSRYPSDWVERIVTAFSRSPKPSLVYGPVHFSKIGGFGGWILNRVYPVLDFAITQFDRIGGQPNVWGPNFAVTREAFQKVGGFVGMKGFEDSQLAYRVAQTFGRRSLRYDRHLIVHASARRYEVNGLLRGALYYFNCRFQMFVLKRDIPEFQDVRISS